MKIIEVTTKREDTLYGCWYGEDYRDVCVIITNGTGGNIFENKFLQVLGDELEAAKISYICAHNSGAFQIIDLPSKNKTRSGVTFELFDNCLQDLQAYVDFAKSKGYKKIILGGHSYGCNKVVYYLYKNKCKDIDNYILLSPTDTQYKRESEKQSEEELTKICNNYISLNKEQDIMPILYDSYNFFTAKSYMDYINNPHHRNLPVYQDVKDFKQLKSIKINGLFVMGELDTFAKRDATNHLKVILENSNNKQNKIKVIKGARHNFDGKETELSKAIITFIKEQ